MTDNQMATPHASISVGYILCGVFPCGMADESGPIAIHQMNNTAWRGARKKAASSGRRSTDRRRIPDSPASGSMTRSTHSGAGCERHGPARHCSATERERHDSLLGSGTGPAGRPGEQDIGHRYPGAGPDNPEATDRLPPRKVPAGIFTGTKKAALGSFFCSTDPRIRMEVYGAADGTRTRDPRRDRPVF